MRSSLRGPHVSGIVRELISLVNNTHVVSGMGFCRGFEPLKPSARLSAQSILFALRPRRSPTVNTVKVLVSSTWEITRFFAIPR